MDEINAIESLLPEKSIIKTRHPGSYDWVTTIIQKAYDNYLEVEQVEDYMAKVLMIGDNLLCKYADNECLYTLETTVHNIKFETQSVVLSVNNVKKVENMRCSYRYDAYLSSSLKSEETIGELYSVVTNLSYSGMSIITKGFMKIGEQINMNIYLSGNNIISFRCEIKWCDVMWPNNLYGVEIVEIDESNRIKFEEYLKKLEIKEKRLLSKYKKKEA